MTEGFEIPFHRSLTEVILLGGLPRNVALMLWTSSIALAFGMQQLWVLPVAVILHLILVALTRRDPFFFDVFIRALKSPKTLLP
jgi:type IV secretory pathway TrbD component